MCSIRRPQAVRKTIDCLFVFSYGVREHAEWWMRARHLKLLLVDCCWCFSSLPLIGESVSPRTHTLYIFSIEAVGRLRGRGSAEGADGSWIRANKGRCDCRASKVLTAVMFTPQDFTFSFEVLLVSDFIFVLLFAHVYFWMWSVSDSSASGQCQKDAHTSRTTWTWNTFQLYSQCEPLWLNWVSLNTNYCK